ncbi:hypothetical protein [Aquamicrobium zhengzhouense]|nr:hypothetical protein [Aquamicrobium zhengzhouense]
MAHSESSRRLPRHAYSAGVLSYFAFALAVGFAIAVVFGLLG